MQVLENINLHTPLHSHGKMKKKVLKKLTGYWKSSTLCVVVKVGVLLKELKNMQTNALLS